MDPQHHAKFQKKLMSQFWKNLRTDRRMDGRKDGRTDRPYFIGPFWPRLGVQKANTGFFFLNNITKKQNFTVVSGFSLEPHWQDESFSSFFRVTQGLRSLQICIFRLIFLEILFFKTSENKMFLNFASQYKNVSLSGLNSYIFKFPNSLIVTLHLTHSWPMFPFYTPWKHPKTFGFLLFSGGIKWEHWPETD